MYPCPLWGEMRGGRGFAWILVGNHHYGQEQAKPNLRYSEAFLEEHPLNNKFVQFFFFFNC